MALSQEWLRVARGGVGQRGCKSEGGGVDECDEEGRIGDPHVGEWVLV